MGASLALAGLTGCRRPVKTIVPYVKQPEAAVPGKDLMYATTMSIGDDGNLRVRAYVLLPILGKTFIWTRVR